MNSVQADKQQADREASSMRRLWSDLPSSSMHRTRRHHWTSPAHEQGSDNASVVIHAQYIESSTVLWLYFSPSVFRWMMNRHINPEPSTTNFAHYKQTHDLHRSRPGAFTAFFPTPKRADSLELKPWVSLMLRLLLT